MAQNIQTYQSKSSKFSQDTILGDLAVTISLQWNARAGYWFLTISDGTYTLSSKKLVANWPILRRSASLFPTLDGDIIAIKTDANAEDYITYDNLNNGWGLYYITHEELQAWETSNGIG